MEAGVLAMNVWWSRQQLDYMRSHVNDGDYIGNFYAGIVASADPGFCGVCKVQVPDTEIHMVNLGVCHKIVNLGAPNA